MHVYCIPGFGVDEKIFAHIQLPGHQLHFINWLEPVADESIQLYAKRMSAGILHPEPVLVGLSFGGIISIEISKLLPVKKIILISSVKCRKEFPAHMKIAATLRLNKMIPLQYFQNNQYFCRIANQRLGAYTDEEKALANQYRKNSSLQYITWSLDKILNWQNNDIPATLIHIHGDQDNIFPIKYVNPNYIISGGTHMMIWNKATEINKIIQQELDN